MAAVYHRRFLIELFYNNAKVADLQVLPGEWKLKISYGPGGVTFGRLAMTDCRARGAY